MKLSNFVPTRTVGDNILNRVHFAIVDVTTTTGHLWWKKTHRTTRDVAKKDLRWFFVDTGEYTPGFQVETLERAYKMKELLK